MIGNLSGSVPRGSRVARLAESSVLRPSDKTSVYFEENAPYADS
jgi:hypothetical protein